MKDQYESPTVVAFGSVYSRTGIFGGSSPQDVLVDMNGQPILTGQLSIDACAEENMKCICADNGTC